MAVQCPCVLLNISFDFSNMRCNTKKTTGFCAKHLDQLAELMSLDEYTKNYNECTTQSKKIKYNDEVYDMMKLKILTNAQKAANIYNEDMKKTYEKNIEECEKFEQKKEEFQQTKNELEKLKNELSIMQSETRLEKSNLSHQKRRYELEKLMFESNLQMYSHKLPNMYSSFSFLNFSFNVDDMKKQQEENEKTKKDFYNKVLTDQEELKKTHSQSVTDKITLHLTDTKFIESCKTLDIDINDTNLSYNTFKKAYRMKILKVHPDKGGDPNIFKQVLDAFQHVQCCLQS